MTETITTEANQAPQIGWDIYNKLAEISPFMVRNEGGVIDSSTRCVHIEINSAGKTQLLFQTGYPGAADRIRDKLNSTIGDNHDLECTFIEPDISDAGVESQPWFQRPQSNRVDMFSPAESEALNTPNPRAFIAHHLSDVLGFMRRIGDLPIQSVTIDENTYSEVPQPPRVNIVATAEAPTTDGQGEHYLCRDARIVAETLAAHGAEIQGDLTTGEIAQTFRLPSGAEVVFEPFHRPAENSTRDWFTKAPDLTDATLDNLALWKLPKP